MENQVSKSKYKPYALQYFREVERTGKTLIITDRGRPVLRIMPYSEKPVIAEEKCIRQKSANKIKKYLFADSI